ncbi:LOW QUALITY PROTEIN: RNA-binding protein 28-like [Lasioglossum baleicum]|uniref:LOW QUALITY PROTEIN: RNA-binding protein 28-like n=1 Tax=Lasioglossum baleicum TaxID=434251 RepID=UPI003FCC328C
MRNTGNRGDKKKLSWMYRKKIKLQKLKKPTQDIRNNSDENKKPRIIVRNIPFKATEVDVRKLYEPFGEILEINFPKRPNGTPVGCCFIQFNHLEDASKAIFNTNKKEFLGNSNNSSWAISKSKYLEKLEKETENIKLDDEHEVTNTFENTQKSESDIIENEEPKQMHIKEEKDPSKQEISLQIKKEKRKLIKEKTRKKRARVVVRNLSFQAVEKDLEEHFSQYGAIEEIKILKRSDGKNIGCAFLQFEHVQSAAKAIHYANLQPLLDRPIIVDWAVPKDKFSKNNSNINQDDVKVKVEKESDTEDNTQLNSNKEIDSEDEKCDIVTEDIDSDTAKSEEVEIETNEYSDEEVSIGDQEEEKVDTKETKHPRFESHDVSEGKTVFLKNVPFSVKNDELKTYMERFGPVHYALICMDSLTEFSKGTAFVKFKNAEDAEKCLSAGNELEMEDQILQAFKALDKNEIENKANLKEHKKKDSRNLYLVKEGVIIAGSPAAAGVSTTDMAKRLQIEKWKSQILRNLNMFVSRVRLVVHNLPSSLDDIKLRKIFERHSPPTAVIREARVMRDLKNVDIKGMGKSKEYGFISFTKHEDALQTLRSVNNNPNIFTPKRRPIVSFSIENRVMVNAKQKRLEKSRENNPLWTKNKSKRKDNDVSEEVSTKRLKIDNEDKSSIKPYTGMIGKRGENKLRSKHNLINQAMVHNETVKKEKKLKKSSKKLVMKKKQKAVDKKEVKPKQKRKLNADDVNLDKLVNRYKDKLKSIELNKSKWYES